MSAFCVVLGTGLGAACTPDDPPGAQRSTVLKQEVEAIGLVDVPPVPPNLQSLPPAGVVGSVRPGSLFLQLEFSASGVALLACEPKPELETQITASSGRYGAWILASGGAQISMRFDVPRWSTNADGSPEVHGEAVRPTKVPVLLKLPAISRPATAHVYGPDGAKLGEVLVP